MTHLLPASASISSKNTIDGAAARARRNNACTAFSLSPNHLLSSSGPRTGSNYCDRWLEYWNEMYMCNMWSSENDDIITLRNEQKDKVRYKKVTKQHHCIPARKFMELSVASALAIKVFEQPGGPYNNTPFGGAMPRDANSSGCNSGHSTTWNVPIEICKQKYIELSLRLNCEHNLLHI